MTRTLRHIGLASALTLFCAGALPSLSGAHERRDRSRIVEVEIGRDFRFALGRRYERRHDGRAVHKRDRLLEHTWAALTDARFERAQSLFRRAMRIERHRRTAHRVTDAHAAGGRKRRDAH